MKQIHGLSKEQIAMTQVETIDIASSPTDYWSYIVGRSNIDFSTFQSSRTGRCPLTEGWQVRICLLCNVIFPSFLIRYVCIFHVLIFAGMLQSSYDGIQVGES